MSAIWIGIFGVIGLFAGSALWVIARNQASRRPLFASPTCAPGDEAIGAAAWLPLFGFGMDRACPDGGAARSNRRLAFELSVAIYWGLATWHIGDWRQLIAALLFTAPLLVILLVDAWTRLVHTNVILAGVALGLVFAGIGGVHDLLRSALGLAVGAGIFVFFFVLAIVIYRNPKVVPFGLGDVYLAAMIGAMVTSSEILRALAYGIFFGGAFIGVLLALKRVNRKQAVPYGPFLVVGALIALLV
jgi:prepilin signal peptidase PulO-like enzyme (type II secretory pathway)